MLHLSTLNPEISDLSGDSARYLLLAQSISQGKGYKEIEKPTAPPHLEYMPALPLLLAGLVKLNLKDLRWAKMLIVGFAFLSMLAFFFFLWQENFLLRALVFLCFSTLPFLLLLETKILSDFPHLFFLLLSIIWFERLKKQKEAGFSPWLFCGLIASIAFYFRQIAVIIFLAGALAILLTKKLKRKIALFGFSLGFLLPCSLWYLRNFFIAGSIEPSYGKKLWYAQASNPFAGTLSFGELIVRIGYRIKFYLFSLAQDFFLGRDFKFFSIIWLALLVIILLGIGSELIKRRSIQSIYFFPYLIVISSWEGWVPRYFLPLIPLSLYFLLKGVEQIFIWLKKPEFKFKALLLILSLLVFVNIYRVSEVVNFQHKKEMYPPKTLWQKEKSALALLGEKNFSYYPDAFYWKKKGEEYFIAKCSTYYHFFAMAEFARKNLEQDAVIVCRKPRLFGWLSQRKSIQFPAELALEKFFKKIIAKGGEYILIEEISPALHQLLMKFWKTNPAQLEPVARFGETYLLKLRQN